MNGRTLAYPSIRVRMDFRDPDTIGMFPYHCHLLEHEDKGMMGTIRVVPRTSKLDLSADRTTRGSNQVKNAPERKFSTQ
jgi:hypothetical protein